jgi:hypothetical protein
VNYQNMQSRIKSGDIIAWTGGIDALSMIRKMCTRCQYAHIGVAWVVSGHVFVIESVSNKVHINPLPLFLPFYHISNGSGVWTPAMEQFLLSRVSEKRTKIDGWIDTLTSLFHINTWASADLVKNTFVIADPRIGDIKSTPSSVVEYFVTQYNSTVTGVI